MATLQAQLAGRGDEHQRLLSQLTSSADQAGYSELLAAAFFTAINDRFDEGDRTATRAAIIDFIANMRSRTSDIAENLDPAVAEQMIFHALGEGEVDDIDGDTMMLSQIIILGGLVADAEFSDSDLEKFMNRIRRLAEGA
ncbi:hypothetical protein ACQPZP_28555 [Spirillospora sp. CA-142024]|uniref:hypothetical protein n=1 Tax=Spirillospora sp. CA-142024 TaxID=3240036 RepID=UPI003D8DE9CB